VQQRNNPQHKGSVASASEGARRQQTEQEVRPRPGQGVFQWSRGGPAAKFSLESRSHIRVRLTEIGKVRPGQKMMGREAMRLSFSLKHQEPYRCQTVHMCEERCSLLKIYQETVATFSTTLYALEAARSTVSRVEYERLAGYVDQARLNSEVAREDLEKHNVEHRCSRTAQAEASMGVRAD
jgi:hypothetical protein